MDRPPYDIAPSGDTLGVRHLREMLRDVEFPQKTSALRERLGHWRIPITGADFHPLVEFLAGVPEKTFRSSEALVESITRAHPELRE